jgi:hypothetical protein
MKLKDRFSCGSEGLEIDFSPWLVIAPPELWLFLPGIWICFGFRPQGGFWIDVTNPDDIGGMGPKLMFQGGIKGNKAWTWRDER